MQFSNNMQKKNDGECYVISKAYLALPCLKNNYHHQTPTPTFNYKNRVIFLCFGKEEVIILHSL